MPQISATSAAHIKQAVAAIYVVGGLYCTSGFFEVSDLPVLSLVVVCVGLGGGFAGLALLHLSGIYDPRTWSRAAIGIGVAASTVVAAYAYTSNLVSGLKLQALEYEALIRAECFKVDEALFRKHQYVRDACEKVQAKPEPQPQ